eukprot:188529_1
MCPKSFKIKGIEFIIVSFPNGEDNKRNSIVQIGFEIKYLPPNIEYFEFYFEIKCEGINAIIKRICKSTLTNDRVGSELCSLLHLKQMKTICFNCVLNIKCIKYKTDSKQNDYVCEVNPMQKVSNFTWNINDLLMKQCKEMIYKEPMYSCNFDNNNWCLVLHPNGDRNEGETSVFVNCLSLPHTIHSMDIKVSFLIDGNKQPDIIENIENGKITATGCSVMKFKVFKQNKSLCITVQLEIKRIYDINNQIINEDQWEQYGIIIYN